MVDTYHNPKLSYLFFNYSIFIFIGLTFLFLFGSRNLFSLLFVLRNVILRGIPSKLNYFAIFSSKNRQ